MNLRQELQAWDDTVGDKVRALALAAEKGFDSSEAEFTALITRMADTAKQRPNTTVHPVPERLNPPPMQGGEEA